MWLIRYFGKHKMSFIHCQQNIITCEEDELILRARESTLRNAHVKRSECNNVQHNVMRYFRVFWVYRMQIAYSLRVVYGKCMN